MDRDRMKKQTSTGNTMKVLRGDLINQNSNEIVRKKICAINYSNEQINRNYKNVKLKLK